MNNEFTKVFHTLKRLLPTLVLLEGRQLWPLLAVVSNNNDPQGLRRIKVHSPHLNSLQESEWVEPLRTSTNHDVQVPKVGQTVILNFLNGDPDLAFYQIYYNDPHPSKPKEDPITDDWLTVEGNDTLEVGGNQSITVEGNRKDVVRGNEDIEVELVRTVKVKEKLVIDCPEIQFKTSSIYINSAGKQILTLGAKDSDTEGNGPDTAVQKGW